MLNIEVIRFEAQDVITASTAAPVEPVCICDYSPVGVHHKNSKTGIHEIQLEDDSWVVCPAADHTK